MGAHAPNLAAETAGRLNLGAERDRVTHVLITCCTGFSAPGLDFALIERCGLPSTVERIMIGFMGCHAAINALKLARHIVRSEPASRVLILNLELCTLLCESVDRHVLSFSKHYLLVPDCDLPLFAHLASDRRIVIPASAFLPGWLRPLPRIIQRNRRQFWWSLRAKPVSGWHVQQFLKIAATISLPHQRYCILDSDVVFFRDFDLSRFEYPHSIPLLTMANAVTADQPRHSRWVETSHRLLGFPTPPLPASDFIGHIIFWDRQTSRALTSGRRGCSVRTPSMSRPSPAQMLMMWIGPRGRSSSAVRIRSCTSASRRASGVPGA